MLRLDAKQETRIGPVDHERLANTDERELAKTRDELARAQAELTRAQEMAQAATAERRATTEPQLARVLDVKARWAAARLNWRQVQIECARRHESAGVAKEELDKAEIVSRNGVELDVEPFRGQYARAHEAWSKCNVKLAGAHGAADAADRQLADAKNQYAHDRLAAAR